MASAAVQSPHNIPTLLQNEFTATPSVTTRDSSGSTRKVHNVLTTLNYHKETEGGGPAPATYAGQPETFTRPTVPLQTTVHDIRGTDSSYTLDKNGFQIYRHESQEKAFDNDERIKSSYYTETEQLLKDA